MADYRKLSEDIAALDKKLKNLDKEISGREAKRANLEKDIASLNEQKNILEAKVKDIKNVVSTAIEKAFAKYALPEVHISVFSDNIPALLLYAGFGFIPYDIEEKTEPNGNRAALIHMKKSKQG